MAQSGHPNSLNRCPLLGVKRTSTGTNPMSAFDPKRTLSKSFAGTPIEFDQIWFQTASASRIRFVIASGCEISARWLASISIVFAPIRLAMKRSKSGLIVRSWVDTA
jgi:hypothetical protein